MASTKQPRRSSASRRSPSVGNPTERKPFIPDELAEEAERDPFSDALPVSPAFPLRYWDAILSGVEDGLAPYAWEQTPPRGLAWIARGLRARLHRSQEIRDLVRRADHPALPFLILTVLFEYFRESAFNEHYGELARPEPRPSHDVRARLRTRTGRRQGVERVRRRMPLLGWTYTVLVALSAPTGRPRLNLDAPEAAPFVYGYLLTDLIYRTRLPSGRKRRYRNWRWVAAWLTDFSAASTPRAFSRERLRRLVLRYRRRLPADQLARMRAHMEAQARQISHNPHGFFRLS